MSRIVVETLQKKYYELAGNVFADYMLRNKGTDEVKRSVEANEFLMGLMNGEFKAEWKLEETDDYKQLVELAHAINTYSKETK